MHICALSVFLNDILSLTWWLLDDMTYNVLSSVTRLEIAPAIPEHLIGINIPASGNDLVKWR